MNGVRGFGRVALWVLLAVLLAAGSSYAANGEVRITFWHPYGPPWDARMEAAAANFMLDYPHIHVEVVAVPDLHQRLPVAVAGGAGPDVAHVFGVANVVTFSDGVLEPIDEYLARLPEWDPSDVIPGFLEAMRFNGKLWALPLAAQPTTLAWGVDAFESAGLPPIRGTIDERTLEEYTRQLTRIDGEGNLVNAGFLPDMWGGFLNWAYHWGGSFFDPKSQVVTASSDANVAALEWIVDLIDRQYGGPVALNAWRSQFQSGSPMYVGRQGMGMWSHYHYYTAYTAAPDFAYGFAPPPQMGDPAWGPKGMVAHADAHVVVKGTEHPLEATLFVLHSTMNLGFFESFLKHTGHPSASISLDRWVLQEQALPDFLPPELFAQHLEVLPSARPWPEVPNLGSLTSAVAQAYNRALAKEVAPRAALEEVDRVIQAELNEILAR